MQTLTGTLLCFLVAQFVVANKTNQLNNLTTSEKSNAKSQNQQANGSQVAVEEILKETFTLLDSLDQNLVTFSNKTPNAMMRDNLRSLDGDTRPEMPSSLASEAQDERKDLLDETSIDEALVKLADGFSSGRKSDDLSNGNDDSMTSAANNASPMIVSSLESSNGETLNGALAPNAERRGFDDQRKGRQLMQQQVSNNLDDNQLASDSTERHVKFTLDLMQSIFASQSYSAQTNQIESFLISPLSIQMVLMMMHLGARGSTRRELSNCLHLMSAAADKPALSQLAPMNQQLASGSGGSNDLIGANSESQSSKLKRRHQQVVAGEPNKQQQHPKLATATTNLRQQPGSSSTGNAHELFSAAMRSLLKDPAVMKALTSANQIFLQRNLPLALQYEWAIKHYYAADIRLVDFQHQSTFSAPMTSAVDVRNKLTRNNSSTLANVTTPSEQRHIRDGEGQVANNIQQIINDWVERQTKGKISNFLSSPISTSTLMMAINVLYFKGDWQYKFNPAETENDASFFHASGKTSKIPMMVDRLPLAFAHDPVMKTSVIELPYKAQRLGLFLLLPDEMSGIFHTMQMLNSTSFANLISSMRKPSPFSDQTGNGIHVRIPKFSIDSSPRLSQILSQQLGIKSLFSPGVADLSGMFAQVNNKRSSNMSNVTSNVQQRTAQENGSELQTPLQVGLDELLHKAILQVDEQGSIAAASSATIVERVGLSNSNYFEADHPFLIFLMDKQTGLVLFSGVFAGNNNSSGEHNNNNNSETQQQRQ